jgi:hypothetical protein
LRSIRRAICPNFSPGEIKSGFCPHPIHSFRLDESWLKNGPICQGKEASNGPNTSDAMIDNLGGATNCLENRISLYNNRTVGRSRDVNRAISEASSSSR